MRGRGTEARLQMQQSFPGIRVPGPQNSPQVISIITTGASPRPVLNPTSLQNLMSAQVTQKPLVDVVSQSGYVPSHLVVLVGVGYRLSYQHPQQCSENS